MPPTMSIINPPFIYILFVRSTRRFVFKTCRLHTYFHRSVILNGEGIVRVRDYCEIYGTDGDMNVCDLTRTN